MKFFNGLILFLALTGAFMNQPVNGDSGDIVTGYVAASIGDSVSSSVIESHTKQALICLPLDFPFSAINITSQCPNYVDIVAYEYMEPFSKSTSFMIMGLIFLSMISFFYTCLFGSDREREQMGDMFIGVFIHSLVRSLCNDDD